MRITFGMMTGMALNDLMTSSLRLVEAQNRASSGKRIQRPSDDVSGTGLAINIRQSLAAYQQYERNSNVAKSELTAAVQQLTGIVNTLEKVQGLALTASGPAKTPEALAAIALQLNEALNALVASANAQYSGNYIFSGSKSDTPAVIANAGIGPPYVYQGDSFAFNIQVNSGTYIQANVTADQVFNMNGTAAPGVPDIFETIQLLKQEVEAGDATAISDRLEDIKANLKNTISIRSQIGARMNRLDAITDNVIDSQVVFKELLSKTEDMDLAQAVLELRTQENVYQAAIAVTSKILQLSLVDYIR